MKYHQNTKRFIGSNETRVFSTSDLPSLNNYLHAPPNNKNETTSKILPKVFPKAVACAVPRPPLQPSKYDVFLRENDVLASHISDILFVFVLLFRPNKLGKSMAFLGVLDHKKPPSPPHTTPFGSLQPSKSVVFLKEIHIFSKCDRLHSKSSLGPNKCPQSTPQAPQIEAKTHPKRLQKRRRKKRRKIMPT